MYSIADEIEKLHKLYLSSKITVDEYLAFKKKLLKEENVENGADVKENKKLLLD